ncbi:MAG: PhoH family protein [Gammaproteobacteria bacterium]|nr:MAG: PhoH family protein [Pseudomonadota bacterium]PIE37887.1 MAG: PhoH family protein [Gammaproteobacteria bacterium]
MTRNPTTGQPAQKTKQHHAFEPFDSQRLMSLCGSCDGHLKHIESRLGARISYRGNQFTVSGEEKNVHLTIELLKHLYRETGADIEITPELVHLFIQETGVENELTRSGIESSIRPVTTPRLQIKPRGGNQTGYVQAIRDHDINFGIGPAGTGKTYLAVACAVEALTREDVQRIMLVRPAVEAGEKLGFLPGDLAQKVDPYLRPLYDALYEMIGVDQVARLIERNVIEIAPLAFMRGRTLNRSFIILDESQNTTKEQMKMFLTRIGFGSTAVITGDLTQIDLAKNELSGLVHGKKVLGGVPGISFTRFTAKDVVRHPLVQRIVEAYDKFEPAQDH